MLTRNYLFLQQILILVFINNFISISIAMTLYDTLQTIYYMILEIPKYAQKCSPATHNIKQLWNHYLQDMMNFQHLVIQVDM